MAIGDLQPDEGPDDPILRQIWARGRLDAKSRTRAMDTQGLQPRGRPRSVADIAKQSMPEQDAYQEELDSIASGNRKPPRQDAPTMMPRESDTTIKEIKELLDKHTDLLEKILAASGKTPAR